MAFPQKNRLQLAYDFQAVFQKGRGVRESSIFLKVLPSKKTHCRFGIIVAKSVEKKAVKRNRIRRLLAQALQAEKTQLRKAYDMIVKALPGIELKNSIDAQAKIHHLFSRASLLKTP